MASTDEPNDRQRKGIPVRGWKFRFDAPPQGGIPSRADEGDILALFQAWEHANQVDRRESQRYLPVETRAYIGWWAGSEFLVTRADLINLSRGGALVAIDRRPPTSQPIWICLGTPQPVHQVQARALEMTAGAAGYHHVRLAFHTPCPVSFFIAAGRRDSRGFSLHNPPLLPPQPPDTAA
jgi:hypothetical protein